MTAVEFIREKLFCEEYWFEKLTFEQIIEQAKEMEKQQIIDAFWCGDNTDCISEQNSKEFAEQYYTSTYGSKGSDEISKVAENTSFATSSQTEISDKVLFEQAILAMEEMYGSGCDAEIDAYFRGAVWYREQLKQL